MAAITDRLTPKVVLELDDQTWMIVVDHQILMELEDLTGLNVFTGEVGIYKPSAKLMGALLYLVLKRAGAKYTQREVSSLINGQTMIPVYKALLAAWEGSMPEPSPDENPTQAEGG